MRGLRADRRALAIHAAVNTTSVPYPADSTVQELFAATVRRRPDACAVVGVDRALRYAELDRLADGVAALLRAEGARPGDVVGICADRSPELIIALVAIVKCGCAYLPFDRSWPDERLHGVFLRAACRLVLTDRPAELSGRFPDRRIVPLTRLWHTAAGPGPTTPGRPDDIAYINFTSGSTGQPKGVPITHRAVARLTHGSRYARLDRDTVLLHMAPVHFDAATFEIWGALLCGGTCVLYPATLPRISELGRLLRENRVTVVFLTTALFNVILDEAPEILDTVPTVLTGGEAHSLTHMDRAVRRYGPDKVVSVYGPTECTTFATYHPVRRLDPALPALPIGLPIQNTRLYLVADDRLCAPGEPGEICLAGPGLTPGYLGMPDATRTSFADREIGGVAERLYRTGDRGYLLDDGNVVFQGRLDDQVKINGHRIELGEIAHFLDRHPDVRQCFVTVTADPAGQRSLVAFVVPDGPGCTPQAIRDQLRVRLPEYMVPATIVLRDSLPLSGTGKVDRGSLLAAARS
ncbi:MAG TPA: amino acid adenylation domain-containing protein [Pseudonocardiaceae bacterium]|nr:amino acid adenylation domain-containing protein [Pseudonocardiaceae bacterium]